MSFIKQNSSRFNDHLIKESAGLGLLKQLIETHHINLQVPQVINVCEQQLELEPINAINPSVKNMAQLGAELAKFHSVKAEHYGLEDDNYIGLNPQENGIYDDWGLFFYEKRLLFQVNLIQHPRIQNRFLEILTDKKSSLIDWLNQYCEHASLVHGDLWSGNVLFDKIGVWLIDPAVYYGDREVDLAMSEMFGGFNHHFYEAYDQALPRSAEYPTKKVIYNLYHYLNHFNLFGEGYLSACQRRFDLVEKL